MKWYDKSSEERRQATDELTCTIEINDACNDHEEKSEGDNDHDLGKDLSTKIIKLHCSRCGKSQTEQIIKCFHTFRSMMEFIEYTPKQASDFYRESYFTETCILHWFGSRFTNDSIRSKLDS